MTVPPTRTRFQGVHNIVRFNAPTYAAAVVTAVAGGVVAVAGNGIVVGVGVSAAVAAVVLSAGSLVGSYLAYDASGLYRWACLDDIVGDDVKVIAHVHTGLDESTDALRARFPHAHVAVFDASEVSAQPEPSIARARRLVPLHPDTVGVGLGPLPVAPGSVDLIVLPMAAHEVRDDNVRARWFQTLSRALAPGGRMVVVEHLRDIENAVAFHVGVAHFLSRSTWLKTCAAAGLDVVAETRPAPLLRLFALKPRGSGDG